jgi:hypothetical protein
MKIRYYYLAGFAEHVNEHGQTFRMRDSEFYDFILNKKAKMTVVENNFNYKYTEYQ